MAENPSDSSSTTDAGRRSSTTLKPCSNCRRRKVRCDKNSPCANCARSGMKCIYEGTGSSDELASSRMQASNVELQDRLSRLECLMESMAGTVIQDTASQSGASSVARSPTAFFESLGPRPEDLGKTVFDSADSVYVDPSCWIYLFDQIQQLRFYLESSGPQQNIPDPITSPFVFPSLINDPSSELDLYPAIKHSELLVNLFFKNVEPFVRMLHSSGFRKELDQYRRQSHASQVEFEALLFSIHACSIVILPETALQHLFGKRKLALLGKFGHEAEKALARADLLKSRSCLTLQAFLYHITFLLECARYDEASALIGLAVRVAQRLGLNHDPSHFNFSPWKVEQRRRIWCYLQHLDFRCSENFATSSLTATLQTDSRIPKHADEKKWETCPFTKKSSEPEAIGGFRDTTFVTLRQELETVQRELMRPFSGEAAEIAQSKVLQYRSFVEQRYLKYLDDSEPMQNVTAAYIRCRIDQLDIIVRQNWLLSHSGNEDLSKGLFVSAVELLQSISCLDAEIAALSEKAPASSWQWILHSSIPWHAMAIVLTNLGVYFQGPLVKQAWAQVDAAYARYSDKYCNLVNTPIWSPINDLRDQARFKRETWVEEEGETPATANASDDGRGGMLNHNLLSAFDNPIDVAGPPLDVGVDFCTDRSFGLDDLVMPDLASSGHNDFLDFYPIPTDQYDSGFGG